MRQPPTIRPTDKWEKSINLHLADFSSLAKLSSSADLFQTLTILTHAQNGKMIRPQLLQSFDKNINNLRASVNFGNFQTEQSPMLWKA